VVVGGKHACVDLIEIFPLVGLGSEAFIEGLAALKVKWPNIRQHTFTPFTFDIFGFLVS